MAHAATLNGLAGNLVTAITGKTKNDKPFAGIRDQTVKGLLNKSHARTNQFAVKAKLDGMVEKFEVLNREDLANALQSRLDELQPSSRWMPEVLSFLLELSDRPADKTILENVESANGPVVSEKDLTWDDILAEDPLSDSEVWENVERGYFSSGDDSFEDDAEPTVSTQATSLDGEDAAAVARLHLTHCDDTLLDDIKETRASWEPARSRDDGHILSELTVVREMLSMMHGLPTDLFHFDDSSARVSLARRAAMATASSHSLYDILNGCVRTGTIVNYLRRWIASPQNTPYLQSIQSCIQKLCMQFRSRLGQIEQRYISAECKTVVSAIQVQTEISGAAELLVRLATLVRNASSDSSPYALLDLLYDDVSIGQMTDSPQTFHTLSKIFLAGLKTYLRPVAAWIKTGSLAAKDDGAFFVLDSNHNCELGEFWHAHFTLRRRADGTPSAPRCLAGFAPKIFALGKSRALMKRLHQERDEAIDDPAAVPSFDELIDASQKHSLMPFSQLLHETLDSWITGVNTDNAPQLQHSLLHDHGLLKIMTALPYVFFSRDGIAFSTFADALIARVPGIVSSSNSWCNQFLLTEVAHNTFGGIPGVDADNVYVSAISNDENTATTSSTALTAVRKLADLEIKYSIPWPVQNITRSTTLPLHNKAFIFLLQVYYASQKIQDRFFELRHGEEAHPPVLKLRQHILCFTALMQAYLANTSNNLHQEMQERMQKAEDIDAMAIVWADHERRLETSLLLSKRLAPVRDAVIRILELSEVHAGTIGPRSVNGLLEQYQRDMAFLIAGVRGVSRAGGEPSLEMLAEKLESVG